MGMIIKKKQYELATEGLHNVTITRYEDLGQQETNYGVKDQVRIYFTCQDQKDKEGNPVDVSMKVNKVINPKSSLGILLEKLGVDGSADEFDLDDIIGIKCQVVVEYNKKEDGRVFANIDSVIKNRKSAEV